MAQNPPQKRQQNAPPTIKEDSLEDYMNNFIFNDRFPVYKYSHMRKTVDINSMTVEKIPMFVDGNVVWTHFKISVKPGWTSPPYRVDVDIKITVMEGKAWLLIDYKGKSASRMIEWGDIVIIPAGTTYHTLNISVQDPFIFTIDANTLLEME